MTFHGTYHNKISGYSTDLHGFKYEKKCNHWHLLLIEHAKVHHHSHARILFAGPKAMKLLCSCQQFLGKQSK